jgi:hypothetical protein
MRETSAGRKRTGRVQTMRLNVLGGLLPIKPREALRDAFAGLTLASMNIPRGRRTV